MSSSLYCTSKQKLDSQFYTRKLQQQLIQNDFAIKGFFFIKFHLQRYALVTIHLILSINDVESSVSQIIDNINLNQYFFNMIKVDLRYQKCTSTTFLLIIHFWCVLHWLLMLGWLNNQLILKLETLESPVLFQRLKARSSILQKQHKLYKLHNFKRRLDKQRSKLQCGRG